MMELKGKEKELWALKAVKNTLSIESKTDQLDDLSGISCSKTKFTSSDDKENIVNHNITRKKSAKHMTSEKKKRSDLRKIEKKLNAPGLGEGEINDDNTAECNQS